MNKLLIIIFLTIAFFTLSTAQICEVKLPFYEYHEKDGSINEETLNISSDGSTVVYAANKRVVLMNRQYGDNRDFVLSEQVNCSAISKNGKLLVLGTKSKILIYDVESLTQKKSIPVEKRIHSMNIFEEKILVVSEGVLRAYSLSGELEYEQGFSEEGFRLNYIRKIDGQVGLANIISDKKSKLLKFNVNTREILSTTEIPYRVLEFEVSPNKKMVAVSGIFEKNPFVEVFNLSNFTSHYKYEDRNLYYHYSLSFSPDSRYLAVSNYSRNKGVRILDVQRKMLLGSINIGEKKRIYYKMSGVQAVQFDRKNNSLFVVVDAVIRQYELMCVF